MGHDDDTGGPTQVSDWADALSSPFADRLAEDLDRLDLAALKRLPLPRVEGLPWGHELRIARRWLAGRSSALDTSGLTGLYRTAAPTGVKRLHRAFALGEPVDRADWLSWLGAAGVEAWTEAGLLRPGEGSQLASQLRVVVLDDLVVLADPMLVSFPGRVHIGQDSLDMVEFLAGRPAPVGGRALDVGTGTGVLLLSGHRRSDHERVGVDINPRAVAVARFNARANGVEAKIEERDVFAGTDDLGRYDLVTWNLPFVFLPESERDNCVDGFGGELGIEITLRFVDLLPSLLTEDGVAYLLTLAPVLDGGVNALERQLRQLDSAPSIDVEVHVQQSSWSPARLREFHREHGVERFEYVILEVRHAGGRVLRREPPLTRRGVDAARGRLHRFKRLAS